MVAIECQKLFKPKGVLYTSDRDFRKALLINGDEEEHAYWYLHACTVIAPRVCTSMLSFLTLCVLTHIGLIT